jgi:hypothetical protein
MSSPLSSSAQTRIRPKTISRTDRRGVTRSSVLCGPKAIALQCDLNKAEFRWAESLLARHEGASSYEGRQTTKRRQEMTRQAKTMGLAVAAMLAMSAVAPSAAQATMFEADTYTANVIGSQLGENEFEIEGGRAIKCSTATFAGEATEQPNR